MMIESLNPHHLLSWMAIQSFPNTYILGSFARHVTIYSQQMRALNLVDALYKTGQLSEGVSVIVVGGGIAGLTAAAAAVVRGADVKVIEKEANFFPIQRHAGKRYLHPHIYDWPLYEIKEGKEDVADFPFLDWEAGYAEDVFKTLEKSWGDFCSRLKPPKELMETRFIKLGCNTDRSLQLTVHEKDHSEPTLLLAQVVILALGFGRETELSFIQKYWDDAPLDSVSAKGLKWLISGYGDGALTDLMRLLITDFRHEIFVKKFAKDSNLIYILKQLLSSSENQRKTVRETFETIYLQLDDSSKIKAKDLRTDTDVTLNAPSNYLESNESSILNRFIVFQLEKALEVRGEKLKREGGRVKLPIPRPSASDKYCVTFIDKNQTVTSRLDFDRLVIRHGPEPALGENCFPEIWNASKELRARWEKQLQSHDRTRVQIWDPADYDLREASNTIQFDESPDDGVDLRCLVLESTDVRAKEHLVDLVKAAVNGNKTGIKLALGRKKDEPDLKVKFEEIKINKALLGQREYNHAVRMICQADVAVIDVTNYEPGVMLFLGIRSAVRRGVTLVTTNHALDAVEWSKLPFNLKELYPLSVKPRTADVNSREYPPRIIGTTIARALDQYHSLAFYQDSPAFEALRRFENIPRQEAQNILWLCSFDEKYAPYEGYIQRGFLAEFGDETTKGNEKKYRLERITEIVSPQVVTQRLYSAIRHTSLCLVDWSFWSANVFFELGVRFAASSMGPVCLLANGFKDLAEDGQGKLPSDNKSELTDALLDQRQALKRLFHPIAYGREGEEQRLFEEIRARHKEMQDYETPGRSSSPVPPTFGAFPYSHTYKLVGNYLPLGNEPGAAAPHELLKTSADALTGFSTTTDPSLPVLYANVNKNLDKQARRAATELLIAAWYYLKNRYSLDELKREGNLLEDYANLSLRLADLLSRSGETRDIELRQSVEETIDIIEKQRTQGGHE